MPVHFSDREMQRAWKNNFQAYKTVQTPCTNAHRLLLFYAIECGLKAVLMQKRPANSTSAFAATEDKYFFKHNLNTLLDKLSAGYSLNLPCKIKMVPNEDVGVGEINQMWRYGGEMANMKNQNGNLLGSTDEDLEKCLLRISEWIKQELR